MNCVAKEGEYGQVIFHLDNATRGVVSYIDGEDNHKLFSYEGLRDGHLAHPIHISHFDIWFNRNHSETEVRGLIKLRNASSEAFIPKETEIDSRFGTWLYKAITGVISRDAKTLGISASFITKQDLQTICNYFLQNGLANGDTSLIVNAQDYGTIESMLGRENPKMQITAQETDQRILALVDQWKNGDPAAKNAAGEQLLMQYDKQLRGLLNDAVKRSGGKVDLDDPNYMDKLQQLYAYFFERLNDFDPTKAKITTFIQSNIALIIKNMFNANRSKIDKHTQTVSPGATPTGDNAESTQTMDSVTYEDSDTLNRRRMTGPSDEEQYENKELLNEVLETSLDPRLYNIIKKKFFEGKTLAEIAEEEGMTLQNVSLLVEKALEKLRMSPEIRNLRPASKDIETMKVQMLFGKKNG